MKKNKILVPLMMTALSLTACEKSDRSFSLLDAGTSFQQSPTFTQRKLDILWVVDSSGSMSSSQTNLTTSFSSFINRFQTLNYDFHMAVTSTDAWRAAYVANQTSKDVLKSLRVGPINFATDPLTWLSNSGTRIMDRTTPNLSNIFIANATQGTSGSGDERAFSSFQEVLSNTVNGDFRRADAVLAIIIVSDEDDFSANTAAFVAAPNVTYVDEVDADPVTLVDTGSASDLFHLYNDPRLLSVNSFKTYLDGLAGAGNYSVNMIGILDTQCKASLNSSISGRRIGRRYIQLADLTGGVKASLCDNFGQSLQLISDSIISLTSTFNLGRDPVVSTIKVKVNGEEIVEDANNGWTYSATGWTVTFHGTAVPAEGATVQIFFTPTTASN